MLKIKDSVDLKGLEKFGFEEYYRIVNKLKETQPHGPYDSLKTSRYYTNYRLSEYAWQYNRHHICEIDVSGAGIMDTEYRNSESIIVDQEQHCLLHYLIVLSRRTSPNHGMLLQFGGDVKQWEEKVVSGCQRYNVEFVKDWTRFLQDCLDLLRPSGKRIYIKYDLRNEASSIKLYGNELLPDEHNVS